jgi:hypothetical protein
VLDKPNYRLRASQMAAEYAAIDTRSEILRIVNQVASPSDEVAVRRGSAMVSGRGRRAAL